MGCPGLGCGSARAGFVSLPAAAYWKCALGLAMISACSSEDINQLRVDVRTDLSPGVDFDVFTAELVVDGRSSSELLRLPVDATTNIREEFTIGTFDGLSASSIVVEVAARGVNDQVVLRQRLVVRVRGRTAVTAVLTRSCIGVQCSDETSSCFAGRCVEVICSQDGCDQSECEQSSQCAAPNADCAMAICANGACLSQPVAGACTDSRYCDPERGCLSLPFRDGAMMSPDAGPTNDASAPETGTADANLDGSTLDVGMSDGGVPVDGTFDALDVGTLDASPPQGVWSSRDPQTYPGTNWHVAAYDNARMELIRYGGISVGDLGLASMATWTTAGWTDVCETCDPGERVAAALYYDVMRGRLVLWGGRVRDYSQEFAELWEYDGSWQHRIDVLGGPSAAAEVAAAYDANRQVGVFCTPDGVFEYDGTRFVGPVAALPGDAAATGFALTYADSNAVDSRLRNTVVLYGGNDEGLPRGTDGDGMWAWNGSTWTPICSACTGVRRRSAALGYHKGNGTLVLVGGFELGRAGTWIPGSWRFVQGSAFEPISATIPGARDTATLTYVDSEEALILLGGFGPSCSWTCAEMLEFR